ncbi:MAG: ABC transporter substrate-binding protein [Kiritimatiellae bacterium]|nr:ABC transporter substrate-binding protein [Kiritimatiellia bacterium]
MKRIIVTIITIALLLSLIMVWGCNKKSDQAKESIKIGAILPLTGNLSASGVKAKQGIEIAVTEINKSAEFNGIQLQVIYEDSKGNPTDAMSAYQKLTTVDGAKIVITSLTGVSLAVKEKAKDQDVIQIVYAMTEDIPEGANNVIRVYPGMLEEGQRITELINKLGVKKIALLNYKAPSIEFQYQNALKPYLEKNNIKAEVISYDDNTLSSMKNLMLKVKKSNPDAMFIAGYYNQFQQILTDARTILPSSVKIFGGINLAMAAQDQQLKPELWNGCYLASSDFLAYYNQPEKRNSQYKFLVESCQAKYNEPPSIDTAVGFDSMYLLAKALGMGGTSTADILKNIHQVKDYQGVLGNVTIQPDGNSATRWVIGQYIDNVFQEIK